MTKELFSSLFKVGEIFNSGGPSDRASAARLKVLSIEDEVLRYQSIRSASPNRVEYSYIDIVLEGFDRIDPKSIQPSIQQVLFDAGLPRNVSTENYVYGIAKEIKRRLAQTEAPFVTSGERVDTTALVMGGGGSGPLKEGALLRVLVDRRERSPEAIRRCKEWHGVKCFGCGFDFEAFYGPIGKGYIHAHHLQPISSSEGEHPIDPRTDLVPLCPNCHAMVHLGGTLLTIEELRTLIETARCSRDGI